MKPGIAWQERLYPSGWHREGVKIFLALSLVPIVYFKYIPGTDMPAHAAIGSVLYRLLHADPEITRYYALHLQPIPYYLIYVFLTPAVGLLGPWWGLKVVVLGIAALTLVAGCLFLRALRCPWPVCLGCIFLVYSVTFFWGFLSTQLGIPGIFLGAWALIRYHETRCRRYCITACLCGLWVCASHVILLLPWAAYLISFVLMQPRRHFKTGLAIGFVSLVPLTGWFWRGLKNKENDAFYADFKNPYELFNEARLYVSNFDWHMGYASHLLFIGVVLAVVLMAFLTQQQVLDAAQRRFKVCSLFLCTLIFCALPSDLGWYGGFGTLLNFRYLSFVEMGLFALVPPLKPKVEQWLCRTLVGLMMVHLVGMVWVWTAFNHAAAPAVNLLKTIPPHKTLAMINNIEYFQKTFALLESHLDAYYVANGGNYTLDIFQYRPSKGEIVNTHIPIKGLYEPRLHISPIGEVLDLGTFDYLLIRVDNLTPFQKAQLSCLDLSTVRIQEQGHWRLLESVLKKPT